MEPATQTAFVGDPREHVAGAPNLVPVQAKVKAFLATLSQYPFQDGVSLNPGNLNYQSLAVKKALVGLQKTPPAN